MESAIGSFFLVHLFLVLRFCGRSYKDLVTRTKVFIVFSIDKESVADGSPFVTVWIAFFVEIHRILQTRMNSIQIAFEVSETILLSN